MKKFKLLSLEDGSEIIDITNFSWGNKNDYKRLSQKEVSLAIDFSISMLNDNFKPRYKHEPGKYLRNEKEYLMDMFIGKLGEIHVSNELNSLGLKTSEVDFKVYQGYDDYDLKIFIEEKSYNISIKTSKANSRLLLLEWGKYSEKGHYLHGMSGSIKVDAFIAPVIKLNSYFIPKECDDYREFLLSLDPMGYTYGYLSPREIIKCKKKNKFLKAGVKLNNSISLEVDNFAIRLDSLMPIENLKNPKIK